jgi:hypothetical protein
VTSFSPEFRGTPLVPPSSTLLRSPFLLGSGAEKSTQAVVPLTGVRRANRRLVELPAAWRGLFARRGGVFNHRALGGASLCLCSQRHGPGSGQWPGRRAPSGRFHGTARVERVKLVSLRLPAVSRRPSGRRQSPPPPRRAGLVPTGLASESFARPFSLDGSLGLCLLLCDYVPLQLV